MDVPELSLRRLARGAAALACLVGGYNFLSLMGAFGPVSCWTGYTASGSASSNGTETTTTPTISRGCESGIDVLLGAGGPPGGGNASVLFSWAVVLLVLVALGGYSAWTGRRYVTWATVVAGVAITVIGVFSIGWYFLLPTLFLSVAALALSVRPRN
ncbi:hypothetical protein C474_08977 [Halogeometricum pallidum JCM 14848]|uniref:Uncharacterized protein n=1 Tax=Halogeometricum pallidum JCM 14848 TaxID=1227487 RepID=M0D7F2_HALPD|nr:hypothetical protein [Halogeometricum pallidum]ELZ31421.1 hypothetical protein C474_08977 [Halogeometricum pallidum JCM 14848]